MPTQVANSLIVMFKCFDFFLEQPELIFRINVIGRKPHDSNFTEVTPKFRTTIWLFPFLSFVIKRLRS